ncbi:MAG: peptidylprolyl isomerase [Bacteroidia bacterium]
MKRVVVACLMLMGLQALAQTQPDNRVLFSVNGDVVTAQEFMTVYNKNNYSQKAPTAADLQEYLDLYIRFKLKVQEAYANGLDTTTKFTRELANYRAQLAQPYLRDKESNAALLQEAYARTTTERRASHIMVRIEENAPAADSLAAYQKAVAIRERLMKGEDFASLARELSEDPSAKDNAGDLGFFSAFRMIYPFEDMAYKTKIGDISPVFRTQFGYHILKATDERPARGEIRVAHLMLVIKNTDNDSLRTNAERRARELYKKVQAGESFEQLVAQYSEDPSSASNQGLLPYFGTGRMVPEFEEAAFALQNDGDISAPILTPYGWHIIKRIDYRPVPAFEQAKGDLEARIARDSRANINKSRLIEKLKQEYKFTENIKARNQVFAGINEQDYRDNSWEMPEFKKQNELVFSFAEQSYRQRDLADYLKSQQGMIMSADFNIFLNRSYNKWIEEELLKYEDSRLEEKHDDFRLLMKEYREGILLFDLTDQMVWSKAVTDSAGLQAFFEANSASYMYNERLDADIFTAIDEKTAKSVRKAAGKKKNTNEKLQSATNKQNLLALKIKSGKFEKASQEVLDKIAWVPGLSPIVNHNGQFVFVRVREVLPPSVKPLNEIRGLVTSDYQQHLEREWLKELENKYKVIVNQETFNSLLPK